MHSKDNFPFNYLPHKKTVFCISVSVCFGRERGSRNATLLGDGVATVVWNCWGNDSLLHEYWRTRNVSVRKRKIPSPCETGEFHCFW